MKQNFTTFFTSKRCNIKLLTVAFTCFLSLSFFSTQVNAQTTLGLGDMAFISYNSDPTSGAGSHQFGLVNFTTVDPGTQVTFTDRGWTAANGFNSPSNNESSITITYTQTINPGDQVYVDDNGNVFNQNGSIVGYYTGTPLTLGTGGDQIFAYQGSEPTPANQSNFITAIQMNGSWNGSANVASTSMQPTVFTDGVNSISISPEVDNASYDFSVISGSTTVVGNAVNTDTRWNTSNSSTTVSNDGNFFSDNTACKFEIECLTPNLTVSCTPPPPNNDEITLIQSCGNVTITSSEVVTGNLLDGTLTIARTYTIVSENNSPANAADDLEAACLQNIRVEAPALPEFVCVAGGEVTCVADITPVAPQLSIECGEATIETSGPALTAGTPNCLGAIYTVTYTATDEFDRIAVCEQNFTIANNFPVIDCPAEATVSCIGEFVAATPTTSISCGGEGTVSNTEPVLMEGDANCSGAIYQVTYEVTDNCDRTSNCTQTITIANDAPVISCAAVPATATCEEAVLDASPEFTVSCGTGTVEATLALSAGTANCNGAIYDVTYTVTDECGRTSNCVKSVEIVNEPPTITCPDNGEITCVADIIDIQASITTSCGLSSTIATVGPNLIRGMPNQAGAIYEVMYTVTDLCGRSANCVQRYTISNDDITVTCPADLNVDCFDDIVAGEANASSNCGENVNVTTSGATLMSGEANCSGAVYRITYTATNNVGTSASCMQRFTLNENVPVITCPDAQTVTCVADITPTNPAYTLSCGQIAEVTNTQPVLVAGDADCNEAEYEITYTVTSSCGASANCTQLFIIENVAPTIDCIDGITATCIADVMPIEPLYSISCGETATIESSSPVLVSGEANCSGAVYEIVYSVTDACNRTANCTQSIVINNDPLTVECPATETVTCLADITPGTPTYSTSCGITAEVTSVGPTLFLGEENCNGALYVVTHTVTDACGNSTECEQFFALENGVPTIQCLANETVSCVDEIVLASDIAYTTSCGDNATVEVDGPLLSEGTPNCTGATYIATYTVTDNCNRVVSCEQTFTVSNLAPTINCVPNATVSCFSEIAIGSPGFETSCGTGALSTEGPTLAEGNANCDGAIYNIVYTVTDACGRTANCTQAVTLNQAEPTISCRANRTVSCITEIEADEANFTVSCGNFGVVTTEGPTLLRGTAACPQSYGITYIVTDECGRTASCMQEFNINNAAPTISCPADANITCVDDIVISPAVFETSCSAGGDVTTDGPTLVSGQPNALGSVYEVVYTGTDVCGATERCTRRFTVRNNAPLISCLSNATASCVSEIEIASPITSISCDGEGSLATEGPDLVSGVANCDGARYAVKYTVTDGSNRSESCTQTITINNNGPAIACPDSKIVTCEAEIVEEAVDATSSCGLNNNVTTVGPVLVSGEAGCAGALYEITYTVTDACNRTAFCNQSFVIDNPEPTINCVASEVVACIDEISMVEPQYNTSCGLGGTLTTEGPTLIAGEENCNGAVYAMAYTVTDGCNRTASCSKTIAIVNDIELVCPMDKMVGCFDELVADTPTYAVGCGGVGILTVDGPNLVSGDMFCGGSVYSFTYTVADECGRSVSCTQQMTVVNCDSDGDGICDPDDVCMGYDDAVDTNNNGTPDGCEDQTPACTDSDNDGVCDVDDICNGGDDNLDTDGNGIPDDCDQCENAYFNFTHAGNSWHDGDLNGSLNHNGQCMNIKISDPYNVLEHSDESGGGLMIGMDPKNVNQHVNICYDFCQVTDNVYFSIRDLDRKNYGYKSSNQQESVCVSGYLNGNEVLPQMSSLDGSVHINGNIAEATTDSKHGKDESVLVEFNQCIDQVCIKYGTGNNSPVSNPTYGKIYIGEGNGIFAEFCDIPCDGNGIGQACSNETLNFQSPGVNWATNSTNGTYTVGNQTYTINIKDSDRILEDTYEHGKGLLVGIDPHDVHDEVEISYNFSTIVNDVSFKIRDLDRKHYGHGSSNQQEAVCVYGYLNGSLVQPNMLSCEGNVHVSGNCAEATADSAKSGKEECVIVNFDKCIDEIKIVYGTGNNSPVNNPTYSKIYIGEGLGFFTGVCGNDCGNEQPCADSDQDGVCNEVDLCADFDDNIDTDGDGIPDACDLCDCTCIDSDLDGVCDEDDICPGSDDNVDMNNNGTPDGCECPSGDDDGDGVCNGADQCPGIDDFSEACQNVLRNNCNNSIAAPSISGVLNESLIISWLSNGTATDLEYRKAGNGQWLQYNANDGFAVLSSLSRCTDYQLRLKQTCNGRTIYSSIVRATTTGCIDCSSTNVDMQLFNTHGTSAILAWDAMPGANYVFHYRELGDANYNTYTTTSSFVILFGLDDCTTYEFAISIVCDDGLVSGIGQPVTFTTTECRGKGGDVTIGDGLAVKVYPNPATDNISIELAGKAEVDMINIYNATGQLVIGKDQINFDGSVYCTNVEHLKQGLYFVITAKDNYIETKQFIVK